MKESDVLVRIQDDLWHVEDKISTCLIAYNPYVQYFVVHACPSECKIRYLMKIHKNLNYKKFSSKYILEVQICVLNDDIHNKNENKCTYEQLYFPLQKDYKKSHCIGSMRKCDFGKFISCKNRGAGIPPVTSTSYYGVFDKFDDYKKALRAIKEF